MTIQLGGSFEKDYDLVDVKWWDWGGGVQFLICRAGHPAYEKLIASVYREKDMTRGRHKAIKIDLDIRSGPLAAKMKEGLVKYLLQGVRGAVNVEGEAVVFDPLDGQTSTITEPEFRSMVQAIVDQQELAGQFDFRDDVMRCANELDSYRRSVLDDDAKNFAMRFAGLSE